MTLIRAGSEFRDLAGRRHERGTVHWEALPYGQPVSEGDELTPYDTVGSVNFGDGRTGIAMGIGVDSFGVVRRLLVADGEEVTPGQALMEFEERAPTLAEWEAERERANRAEQRIRDQDSVLGHPLRALMTALRRRFR